jgi:hypothetical protein
MSSPAAGRFQDHYEVLGVDHKAGSEAIQTAYARLAQKYNPKTGPMPDQEKFDALTLALEVLSDLDLRAEFDKLKGIGQDDKPKFSGLAFFEAYGRDIHLRIGLLCVLYDRRRSKPFTPALSMRHIEAIFNASSQEINFALWYLKQRELVVADDKSSLSITTNGMDYLVQHVPDPKMVMQLIRSGGLMETTETVEPVETIPEVKSNSTVVVEMPELLNNSVAGSAQRIGDILARRHQH